MAAFYISASMMTVLFSEQMTQTKQFRRLPVLCAASQNFVIDVHAVDDRAFIRGFGNDVLIKVAQSPFQPRCTI